MDSHTFGLSLSAILLVATSSIPGFMLLGKSNYLLAALWLLLSVSGLNFLFFGLYGVPAAYEISLFCDEIATSLGIPMIATAGLMAVTHQYRPAKLMSSLLVVAVLAAGILLNRDASLIHVKQALSAGIWMAFSIYLCYFAKRLAYIGEFAHAVGVVVVLLAVQVLVVAGNIQQLLGRGESLHYEQYEIIAGSFLCIELFLAYCAMERSGSIDADETSPGIWRGEPLQTISRWKGFRGLLVLMKLRQCIVKLQ